MRLRCEAIALVQLALEVQLHLVSGLGVPGHTHGAWQAPHSRCVQLPRLLRTVGSPSAAAAPSSSVGWPSAAAAGTGRLRRTAVACCLLR